MNWRVVLTRLSVFDVMDRGTRAVKPDFFGASRLLIQDKQFTSAQCIPVCVVRLYCRHGQSKLECSPSHLKQIPRQWSTAR